MRNEFQPGLVEIIRTAIRNRLADVRTSIPAIVKSYDAATQTCSCEIAVLIPNSDGTEWEQIPWLEDIPVVWPRGGGYFCSMPLAAGDAGLLVFSEVDFSAWREFGKDHTLWKEVFRPKVSDAVQERRHGMYGYFVPGGCASGNEIVDAAADKLVIGKDGGPVLKIDGAGLELGAAASQYVALANLVKQRLDTIQAAFDSHTHTVATTGTAAAQTGTAAPVASPIGALASVAATKVKAE